MAWMLTEARLLALVQLSHRGLKGSGHSDRGRPEPFWACHTLPHAVARPTL